MTTLYVLVGLILLIIIHELGHFLAAKLFRIRVDEFGLGFPPRLVSKKIGETVYSLNLIPFGGFVRIFGESPFDRSPASSEEARSFLNQPAWKRALVLAAGVSLNIIAGWLIFSFIFLVGTKPFVVVQSVVDGSPAAQAGFRAGDIIVGFTNVDELVSHVDTYRGRELALEIKRGADTLSLTAVPRSTPPLGEGALGVSLIGGGLSAVPFGLNFWEGAKVTAAIIWGIVLALLNLFQVLLSGAAPDVVGPVGLLGFANQMSGAGAVFILHLLAMISLNLAVINLFPFPALDGGRLLFLLIEKIKGSPLPPKFEAYANGFGFALLLLLMVLVTVRDVTLLL